MQFQMIPFPPTFYPHRIRIQRVTYRKSQGSHIPEYLSGPEAEVIASVESSDVSAVNPDSRKVTVKTVYTVRTPVNWNLKTFDKIVWTDRNGTTKELIAEGPSTAKGIGDIQYKTECIESA
jgi:hypothetical protein